MPFKKGTSGNPSGRPKGTVGKGKLKKNFLKLFEESFPRLQEDLNSMAPKDRANFLLKYSEFVLPKLARVKPGSGKSKKTSPLRKWVITPVEPPHED